MTERLVLRTCDKDGTAYNGFQWPTSGLVECPDWKPQAECGNGLHGILWPEGNWSDIKSYDEPIWQVVKVQEESLVHISGKVKFPRGEVVYSGEFAVAFTMVAKEFVAKLPVSYAGIVNIVDGGDGLTTDKDGARIGSSGYGAQIGSSGYGARIDATGENAVIACAATICRFKSSTGGCISAPWNDGERTRFAVGYVGENIKADTWYMVSKTGDFVED